MHILGAGEFNFKALTQRRQGGTPEDERGHEIDDRDENVFAWPDGCGENIETAISGEVPGPTCQKGEVGRRRR